MPTNLHWILEVKNGESFWTRSSFLSGGAGNDQLTVFGGSANVLDGGDGKDTLTSGIGDDSMFGGDGADTLVFAAQNGHDTAHFEQGRDIIDLTALARLTSMTSAT